LLAFDIFIVQCLGVYFFTRHGVASLLVMIRNMSVRICNRFRVVRANSGNRFSGSTSLRQPRAQISLNLGARYLNCWVLRSMLKISYAHCLGPSVAILAQFTLKTCVAVRNREKFTKTSYFGGSKLFNVTSCLLWSATCLCLHLQPFLP